MIGTKPQHDIIVKSSRNIQISSSSKWNTPRLLAQILCNDDHFDRKNLPSPGGVFFSGGLSSRAGRKRFQRSAKIQYKIQVNVSTWCFVGISSSRLLRLNNPKRRTPPGGGGGSYDRCLVIHEHFILLNTAATRERYEVQCQVYTQRQLLEKKMQSTQGECSTLSASQLEKQTFLMRFQ